METRRNLENDMIEHHVWCTEAGKVIEGSCRQCEELLRRYPAQGSLDYTDLGTCLETSTNGPGPSIP